MEHPDSIKRPLPNHIAATSRPAVSQPELTEPEILTAPTAGESAEAKIYTPDDQVELQREIDRLVADKVCLQSQSAAIGQEISDLKAQINDRRRMHREVWRELLVVKLEMKLGRALLAGYTRYNSTD